MKTQMTAKEALINRILAKAKLTAECCGSTKCQGKTAKKGF